MMLTLMEFHNQNQEPMPNFKLADLILEVDPKNVAAMTLKANAFYWVLQQRFKSKYSEASTIPADQQRLYMYLSEQNHRWAEAADALGYTEMTPAQQNEYLQSVVQEKSVRQGAK